ncbi:MAG: OmpA family protein [Acidimicrobiales bacterium]
MPSIIEAVSDVLDTNDGWAVLAQLTGGSTDSARAGVAEVAPALLGALAERADDPDGRAAVMARLDEVDPAVRADPDLALDGTDRYGRAVLDTLFGPDRGPLRDAMAEHGTLGAPALAMLLPRLTSLVMAVVAGRRDAGNLDSGGVVTLLAGDAPEDRGSRGSWLTGLVAGGAAAGVAAGVATRRPDGLSPAEEMAEADAVDADLEAAADRAVDADPGAPTVDAAGDADVEHAAAGGDATDGSGPDAGADDDPGPGAETTATVAAGAAGAAVAGVAALAGMTDAEEAVEAEADAVDAKLAAASDAEAADAEADVDADDAEAGAGPDADADADSDSDSDSKDDGSDGGGRRTGAAAAAAAVATAGGAATRAGSDDPTTDAGGTGSAAAVASGGDRASGENMTSGENTTSGENDQNKTSGTGTVGTDPDGRERGGVRLLWWVLGGTALVGLLALTLGQCGSGSSSPSGLGGASATTSAVAGATAEGSLRASVDAELPDGVTAEIDGDAVTLTGSVASRDESHRLEAAVMGLDGVGSVDNRIEVDGSGAGTADPDLQARVDAVLPDGVTATLDGDTVALSGVVGSGEAAAAVEEAVAGLAGVGSVESALTVPEGSGTTPATPALPSAEAPATTTTSPGAPTATPAVGTNLNELLGLQTVTFNYLSAQLTGPGQAVLNQVVAYLATNEVTVQIQGHTDSDGPEDKNQQLSERRATAVRDYLVGQGVAAEQLTVIGLGETMPAVPNDSQTNKALNRRIDFVVTS